MSEAIRHYTNEFRSRRDVSPYDAEALFDALIAERDEAPLIQLLTAWSTKGWTQDELYRFASIMRSRMRPVDTKGLKCVDIVGTGGSSAKTFNVSTAAAFAVAGAGTAVAKHGNRAATSSSGSSDALSLLGVNVDVDPRVTERSLADVGMCFMFAPRFHSLSPTLAKARRAVPGPTIFNCLGPLCNPAGVEHQVIGVWDRNLVLKMANVLALLGTKRTWVVNGHDKLDEISLTGHSTLADVTSDGVSELEVSAADMGITTFRGDLPKDCSPKESASIIRDILGGKIPDSDAEKLVIINAAAAIYIAGGADDLHQACDAARESLRSGAAAKKLAQVVTLTK